MDVDRSAAAHGPSRIVCVGSSAGGPEDLEAFLGSLPVDLPFCFIVAHQMAPGHDGLLRELVVRNTTVKVNDAHDGAVLEPGVVLVAPPGTDVTVDGRTVRLVAPGPRTGPGIELLLESAARSWGHRVVAVVLSGSGRDGSAGVLAVRAAGGVTIALPGASVAADAVDLILPADRIGAALERLAGDERVAADDTVVELISTVLRASGGADHSGYDRASLTRQIDRRRGVLGLRDLNEYHARLVADTAEVTALSAALLMTVTSFSRGPGGWTATAEQLRSLLAGPDRSAPLRLWVPGCATGEEAYTLGMIAAQLMGDPGDLSRRLTIFATDLDEDALRVGRAGSYSDGALEGVPEAYRRRWFRRGRDHWAVEPGLRGCVNFARHDVARDPPFPGIHLVSLRDTLSSFDAARREQALRLLHGGLVPGGVLLLGAAERIGNHDLFEPLDATDHPVYRRRTAPARTPIPAPAVVGPGVDERTRLRAALLRYAPPSLILDGNDDVIEVVGDVAPWCARPGGRHGDQAVALVREELRAAVRSLVLRVRQGGAAGVRRLVATGSSLVLVDVARLGTAVTQERAWLVVSFAAQDSAEVDDPDTGEPAHAPVRWVHEAVGVVAADEAGPGHAVVGAVDVADRRDTGRGTDDAVAVLEAVFDNSVFGVLVLNTHDRIVQANDRLTRMSGYDRATLVGMPIGLLTPDPTGDGTGPTPEAPGTLWTGTAHRRLVARDGTSHQVTMEIRPLARDASARIVLVHDVPRLPEVNHEPAAGMTFDQQTGLLARAQFRVQLGTELGRADRSGTGLALLWIDLDGFKAINDRYGHQAGDQALREVAARLQQTARRQDSVGRLGGDEFAMIVTGVDQVAGVDQVNGLELLSHRVLEALRGPIQVHDTQIYLSGSVGLALAPEDGTDPDDLLHRADTAMYSAKQAGRDRRVYYRAEMNRVAEASAGIRHDLAVALRAHRFELHYQPIVDVRSGRVHAVEALIRWRNGGVIVPAFEFMAVAEQTGQLRAIGHLSLDLVDEDLRTLHAALGSTPVSVCVNLSPTQLEEIDLLDRFIGWEPAGGFEQLVIEVTEGVALARGGRAAETLGELQKLGAQLSIDDFGTGYSNLALLERLRPSVIKMDRSMVVQAGESPRGLAVLSAAIALAHALEAEVVVEGVEDQRLWDLVGTLGVEYAQGYHIARPMPLPDLLGWMDGAGERTGS